MQLGKLDLMPIPHPEGRHPPPQKLEAMLWVVLLRGVNVGGRGRLPMKELRGKLESSPFSDRVATYIQSGNLLMESKLTERSQLCLAIAEMIQENFGFTPSVQALSRQRLTEIAEGNPYPDAEKEPKTLHLYFLSSVPENPKLESLEAKRIPSESFQLQDDVLYLHAPDGIGRSKLAAAVEKAVGVSVTARNWNTVSKLLSMEL